MGFESWFCAVTVLVNIGLVVLMFHLAEKDLKPLIREARRLNGLPPEDEPNYCVECERPLGHAQYDKDGDVCTVCERGGD